MFKLVTALSASLITLLAVLIPSWHGYLPSLSVQNVSEGLTSIQALAAAQNYTSTTVLTDPLVIYLDNFLSAAELDELVTISNPLFVKSQVYSPDDTSPPHRTSLSCTVPSSHNVTSIVSARALQFLSRITDASAKGSNGFGSTAALSYYGLEHLQLVKYHPSQYYHHHVDWFDALIRDNLPGRRGKGKGRFYNREASFFIYIADDCVGGNTEFPDLKMDREAQTARNADVGTEFWEERMTSGQENQDTGSDRTGGSGVAFKPRKGSGIFWVNLHASGFGDDRVSHAALPVEAGEKIGMNIWVKRDFGW